jgi:hypothetical protein
LRCCSDASLAIVRFLDYTLSADCKGSGDGYHVVFFVDGSHTCSNRTDCLADPPSPPSPSPLPPADDSSSSSVPVAAIVVPVVVVVVAVVAILVWRRNRRSGYQAIN